MKAIGVLLCCVAAAHCAVYFEEKFDGAAAALIAAPCATVQVVWPVEAGTTCSEGLSVAD
jgi:hypothetical protein